MGLGTGHFVGDRCATQTRDIGDQQSAGPGRKSGGEDEYILKPNREGGRSGR